MDPNVTWATINDTANTVETRAEAAVNLLAWLANGGFKPDGGWTRRGVTLRCEQVIGSALDRVDPAAATSV